MIYDVKLKKVGERWEFESEADLENFLWSNLSSLLQLQPLAKQYSIDGQICDILAINQDKQLLILELKNAEDRYVVQQITRYYDVLQDNQPFGDKVDYQKDIILWIIAPHYHRDNLIDQKYSKLTINFIQFNIVKENERFFFQLVNFDSEIPIAKVEIYPDNSNSSNIVIPSPPKTLLNAFAKTRLTETEKENILKIRQKILSFDSRIKDIKNSNRIMYGKGKTKPCAEFYIYTADTAEKEKLKFIYLFLWLPYQYLSNRASKSPKIVRTRVDSDWIDKVSYIGHTPNGVTRPKRSPYRANPQESLHTLIDMALSKWLDKQ